ncbi:bi-domain-containing oxidoreductase [Bacteroidota bacterium]
MKQVTQQLKSGKMEILEVPFPICGKKEILVRNHYSVISPGTEGRSVSDARKGLVGKALSRKKELQQVLSLIKINGLLPTYNLVMNKLSALSPLGYSSAGEVIAIGEDIEQFKVGDFVACGGNTAFHADVISVPKQLCVKVPNEVDLKDASFTTIGSIAMQGIRQADLKVGEFCVVIGMGLLGILTAKILESAGINTLCLDIKEQQVEISNKLGLLTYNRNTPGLDKIIHEFSGGIGADAVIIAATSDSKDPIEFAGEILRQKGKVIIVGAVPTGFSRSNYFKKELELRMSTSYGPGRYDINYEIHGHDYPIGYVRWTENRNMQSFIGLLAKNQIDIRPLISQIFPVEEAPDAYQMILEKSKSFTGLLIEYEKSKIRDCTISISDKPLDQQNPVIGLIGAGSFAQNVLLPELSKISELGGVMTSKGHNSRSVADKYGFNFCTSDSKKIIQDESINTIFITTRHNNHACYVIEAMEAGKIVFCEKPLAITMNELNDIMSAYIKLEQRSKLMIGYNRRFAPAVQFIKKSFDDDSKKVIIIRVNAGYTPNDHWTMDPEIGGGRIIGEGCHFIDLAKYIAGSNIDSLHAYTLENNSITSDNFSTVIKFNNGSIATVNYLTNGSKKLDKEYLEVYCNGNVIQINDFSSLIYIQGKSVKKIKFKNQDKGHKAEIRKFIESVKTGNPTLITFEDLYETSLATFKVIESINTGRPVYLNKTE